VKSKKYLASVERNKKTNTHEAKEVKKPTKSVMRSSLCHPSICEYRDHAIVDVEATLFPVSSKGIMCRQFGEAFELCWDDAIIRTDPMDDWESGLASFRDKCSDWY